MYKTFGGHKLAVDHLSIEMLSGQVTCLLGHNGAGKTTLLSILVGLYEATSGTATINGHDITEEQAEAREGLGLCPQFDVLFDSLTVEEHLRFYATLKGMNSSMSEIVSCRAGRGVVVQSSLGSMVCEILL